jgi:hypothetical protein
MGNDSFVLVVAVIAVLVSVGGMMIAFYNTNNFQNWMTGYASTAYGNVSITIASTELINFSDSLINFGSGYVLGGCTMAYLNTSVGTSYCGSWGGTFDQLQLQNIGNVNVSIDIRSNLNASDWLNGTGPAIYYNVTGGVTGAGNDACLNSTVNRTVGWWPLNQTDYRVCANFSWRANSNIINISVRLHVPLDAPSASHNVTIIATGTASAIANG